jgi:hypothetical protein
MSLSTQVLYNILVIFMLTSLVYFIYTRLIAVYLT